MISNCTVDAVAGSIAAARSSSSSELIRGIPLALISSLAYNRERGWNRGREHHEDGRMIARAIAAAATGHEMLGDGEGAMMNLVMMMMMVMVRMMVAMAAMAAMVAMYVWAHRHKQRGSRDPMTWPVLGAQLEAARNYGRLLDWITGFFDADHRTVTMRTLGRTSYLTVDPANIQHILKTNFSNYPKGQDLYVRMFDMLGNGILNTDGDLWKSHRKLASLEFSVKKLRKLSSTVYVANALKLLNLLASRASQGVDMQELLLAMAFDSSCQFVLGEELDTLSSPSGSPYGAVSKAMDNAQEMITRRYMFPWWRIQRYLGIGSEKIFKEELAKFKHFLATVIHKRRAQLIHQIVASASIHENSATNAVQPIDGCADRCAAPHIEQKIMQNLHNAGAPADLLSRFLMQIAAKDITTCAYNRIKAARLTCIDLEEEHRRYHQEFAVDNPMHSSCSSGTKLCDELEEVRDAMMNFMLAGRDTTGSTLSWFLYCMCNHPDKQERVFQELMELQYQNSRCRSKACNDVTTTISAESAEGDDQQQKQKQEKQQQRSAADPEISGKPDSATYKEFAELLTYDNLQTNLPYLHAALSETLRLYPAVPRDGKVTLCDDVLPDGTVLKAGDQIAYMPYSMGRMRFLWGDDALEFKPERWLAQNLDDDAKTSLLVQQESPFKFTAFQAGPRMCLGKDAAYLQMKITAALLLRFFRFELVPDHPVTYRMMAVMSMKHGLKLNFSPRS